MNPGHRRQFFARCDRWLSDVMERIPLRRLCLYVLSVPLLFILSLIVALTFNQAAAQRAAALTEHSLLVISRSERLTSGLNAAQSGLRGYAFTGDPVFLRDYQRAVRPTIAQLADVQQLVRDNPEQLAAAARLRVLGERYLTLSAKTVDLLRHGSETEGIDVMNTLVAPLVGRFDAEMQPFLARARALQAAREVEQRRFWRVVNALLATGIASFFLALLVSFGASHYSIRRITRLRDRVAEAGHVAAPELQLGSCNEIYALDRAFSQMAKAIADREEYLLRYELLSKQALDIIVFIRRSDGHILDANESAVRAFGYTRSELLKLTAKELRPPEATWEVDRVLAKREVGGRTYVFPGLRKDGSRFPLEFTLQATTIAGEEVILAIGRDVSERVHHEEVLSRYELLTRAARDIIAFIRRSDGRIIEANEAAARAFGYPREEFLRLYARQLRPLENAHEADSMIARTDSEDVQYEAVYRRKDGTTFPLEVRLQSATIGGERMVLCIARDIAERKRAEDTHARFQLLSQHARDEIYFVRLSDGRILDVNDAMVANSGYSRDELLSMHVWDLLPPEERAASRARVAKVDAEGSLALETRRRRKDATEYPIEVLAQAATIGGARVALAIARDVSERKRGEEALNRFRLLSEHAGEIFMFLRRHDMKIIDANDAALRAYGYSRDELLDLDVYHLRAPEGRADLQSFLAKVDAEGYGTTETVHLRKNGTTFPAEVSVQATVINGERIHLAIVRDMTERRRIEAELAAARDEALEAARLKAGFLANMSHEIRTPMNAVVGATDLLAGTQLTAEQRDYVEILRRSADALLSTINNVLDISKLEAGKVELDVVDLNLDSAVADVVELLASQAQAKNLSLTSYVSPALPPVVRGDAARVRQILLNLVGNAVKFTDRGGVTVIAVPEEQNAKTVTVRFSVSDTGIGLSEAARRRLFQPFIQADGSTARKFGGTGLGLSICKHLVEMMGGSIGVESAEGKGSIFWFTSLFGRSTAPAIAPGVARPELTAVPSAAAGDGPAVLVVEDDALNRRIALRQLERLGYLTHAVAGGREAIDAVAQRSYDLIFMDCQMPDVDGFEATRRIRRLEAGTGKHVPIIAMTANVFTEDRDACLAAGMDDHIGKPVTLDTIRQVLARWSWLRPSAGGPRPTPALAAPPVDLARLRQICGHDEAELRSLASVALTAMREQLDALHGAVRRRDLDSAAAIAHKLRGSSGNLGATEMAGMSLEVEQSARTGNGDGLGHRCTALEEQFSRVEAFLISGVVAARQDAT